MNKEKSPVAENIPGVWGNQLTFIGKCNAIECDVIQDVKLKRHFCLAFCQAVPERACKCILGDIP
jgi:hypothetical protein